jgi:hypothetical protein
MSKLEIDFIKSISEKMAHIFIQREANVIASLNQD